MERQCGADAFLEVWPFSEDVATEGQRHQGGFRLLLVGEQVDAMLDKHRQKLVNEVDQTLYKFGALGLRHFKGLLVAGVFCKGIERIWLVLKKTDFAEGGPQTTPPQGEQLAEPGCCEAERPA